MIGEGKEYRKILLQAYKYHDPFYVVALQFTKVQPAVNKWEKKNNMARYHNMAMDKEFPRQSVESVSRMSSIVCDKVWK